MAHTRRATVGVSWWLRFAGEPLHLKASAPVCQDGRKPVSASGASPKFRIDLAFKRPLGFSSVVFPLGTLTFGSAGAIEVTTSAIIVVGIAIVVLLAIICARGRANKRLAAKNHELSAALRQFERKAKESEAALKQQIEKLEHKIASLLEAPSQEPLREVGAKVRLVLPPEGREVFLPMLDPSRVYQVTIRGICKFSESRGWFSRREAYADALYRTDKLGNFLECHDFLKLGEVPISRFLDGVSTETTREVDREAHRYSFRMDGTEKKLSATFHVAFKGLFDKPNDPLTLTVELLPEGTPSPLAARQAAQAARENAARKAKLESLRLRAHRESHLLDAEFQERYATHHFAAILQTWKEEWAREYDGLMQDTELKQLAQREAPEVLGWLEARVNIVHLVERMRVELVERMLAAPSPVPRRLKRKKIANEERASRLRRHESEAEDKIALAKLKAKKVLKAAAALKTIPVDPEARERLETELIQDIFELGKEGGNNGQDGTTL